MDVTVVVAALDDPYAKAVHDLLATWATGGLVRPPLWWVGQRDGEHHARWSGTAELGLLTALAAKPYEVVRLVSLVLVPAAGQVPVQVREQAEALEEAIRPRLADHQRLYRVNLVIPATRVHDLPVALLSTSWDANVVVADEDRPTSRQATDEIRYPGSFLPHAALALATAGGLWPGIRGAPFDGDREGAGEQEPRVRIMRSSMAIARSHGLADEVSAELFDPRRQGEWMAQAIGGVPAADPVYLVRRAAREFFDHEVGGRLRHDPYVASPAPTPMRITGKKVLAGMWAASRPPREWTGELAGDVQREIEDYAEQVTLGDDDTAGDTVGLAEALRDRLGLEKPAPADPAVWSRLRTLAFSLADGGDLPEGCTEPLDGTQRQVIVDPSAIEARGNAGHDSLLGLVGDQIAGSIEDARQRFASKIAALKEPPRRELGDPGVRGKTVRVLVRIAAVALVGLVLVIALAIQGQRWWVWGGLATLSLLGWLAGSALAFSPYLRREVQLTHRRSADRYARHEAAAAALHEAEQLVRLAAAYQDFRQWATVIGSLVHLPSGLERKQREDSFDPRELVLPSALRFAIARSDGPVKRRIAGMVTRECFGRGWLSTLCSDLERQSIEDDPQAARLAARYLAAELGKGAVQRRWEAGIRQRIVQRITSLEPDALFSRLCAVGGGALEESLHDFFSGICPDQHGHAIDESFADRMWRVGPQTVEVKGHVRLWLPTFVKPPDPGTPHEPSGWVAGDGATALVLRAARVDVTEPTLWSDLQMFNAGPGDSGAGLRLGPGPEGIG